MRTKEIYIQPKIKKLLVDTESLAGLPATGPDDPSVGAKGVNADDMDLLDNGAMSTRYRSVWDE